ncbi:MAG: 5-(carboxyamino)imidazole ribonucleotide mutase [Thermoplasmataceae archaeon]
MPKIGIIMGSRSDLEIMSEAKTVLDQFSVESELNIISAHRTPEFMFEYAKNAESRGIKVIIAGAGGSAHLPGMTASLTLLPVIGVPIMTKSLKGIDSLLSIVQMPYGIPVATVAINGAKNAAILAIRILSIDDKGLSNKLKLFMETQKKGVMEDKI